jgi:CBS domain-containing protein
MGTERVVENHMTEFPRVATKSMTAHSALRLMDKYKIRHLPVVEGKRIIGVVSERDLIRKEPFLDSMNLVVSDVMVANPYVAQVGTPLVEITQMMASHKYGCTVIVDSFHNVTGIFTTTDALKLLTDVLQEESNTEDVRTWTVEDYFEWDASTA